VVSAGVSDDAATALFVGERGNLVVCPAQFERPNGLEVLGLKVEAAVSGEVRLDQQGSAMRDAAQAGLSEDDVVEGNDGSSPDYEFGRGSSLPLEVTYTRKCSSLDSRLDC